MESSRLKNSSPKGLDRQRKALKTQFVRYLLLFLSLILFNCLWKNANLQPEKIRSVSGKNEIVLTVQYEEKQALNPMEGTTRKRKYRSKLEFGNQFHPPIQIESWILPSNLIFLDEAGSLLFIQGINDNYGSPFRKGIFYNLKTDSYVELSNPASPNSYLQEIAVSPDGSTLATVWATPNEDFSIQKIDLGIYEIAKGFQKGEFLNFLRDPILSVTPKFQGKIPVFIQGTETWKLIQGKLVK